MSEARLLLRLRRLTRALCLAGVANVLLAGFDVYYALRWHTWVFALVPVALTAALIAFGTLWWINRQAR